MTSEIISIFLLLLVSAFFSGTEIAIFSLSGVKVSRITETKNKKAARLKILLQNPDLLLSVILLGNLTVNIIFSHIAHKMLSRFLPQPESDILILLMITVIILIGGEIFPKVLALRYAEKWSINAAHITVIWMRIAEILAWPLHRISQIITGLVPQVQRKYNETEILDTLKFAHDDGVIHENEYRILKRTIHFYHDTAYSIMIPKSGILMISIHDDFHKARKAILERKSELALLFNEKDNRIEGYISARSLLLLIGTKKARIADLKQPLVFLPKTMMLNDVLEELIKNHLEVAAITDEMGEFSGIVTIKEIFHTLLGNFEEEPFLHQHGIQKVNIFPMKRNIYRIMGLTTLHEFNDFFKTDLVSENSETLSGYLVEKLDGYPRPNTIFTIRNLRFYQMIVNNNVIAHTLLHINYE